MYGALKAGIVPIPLNYRFQKEELRYVLKDSGAAAVFTLSQHAAVMSELQKEEGYIQQIVVADGDDKKSGTILLKDIVAEYSGETEIYPALDDDLAMIMYTSGTTASKRCPADPPQQHRQCGGICVYAADHFTDRILLYCASVSCRRLRSLRLRPFLPAAPWSLPAGGGSPTGFLETVEKNKVTWAFLVGLMGASWPRRKSGKV